ncbi:2-hydroxychromene-2-carboxylate isomerase [Zhongshania aliphaticivorans]|uniref:2-hydroxychromene-2-carboxylate isomerase n=1 Tax=Zhongshania aliphaticivorans TaxID=1470434 RepID=A0A5S9MQ75_9GAMM|nr:2-hydroxychromene-2-carboxylate isomerase [Zhongshania aliphaticivorans]CAA0079204.1 2-hydroxychromene-2-carboxylate isomerase [Zhongshania aliphaticivorans]CAA0086250.1 2-hydroxychromene-2-carboxylate isomerase [Zhongshania aliphaticivorans]
MAKSIEFYFDLGSPASYVAWTQLPLIAQRTGAELIYKPMLLGGVFKATGNESPAMIPSKGRYMRMDLQRAAKGYNVAFNFNPHFPINTLMLMRGAVAYLDTPRFVDYMTAVYTALWVDGRNMNDPADVEVVLLAAGFDFAEVMALCADAQVKNRLKDLTQEAIDRDIFGAPTCFVGDEMFFGQDRLDILERALQ